ncbi:hypothetical protein [Halorarum salinum]|uniref:Uncharacterized protein n=1 Tax=Halorarum salinum TaxID=2743089 RepID=A0A7D5QFF0_9EURY|nr:hypothetical protein [Halobaculum salinum]QLG61383.1 hypothetical protein HUG12_06395 [Halobaculum salinum]
MERREEGVPDDVWIVAGLLATVLAAITLLVWYVTGLLARLPNPVPA